MLYPSIQERLRTQHQAAEHIIKPFTDVHLQQQPQPGKWSAYENLAHLVSYQPQFIRRLHKMLETDNPLFDPYVGDNDPAFLQCRVQDRGTLFRQMEADRREIIALVEGADAAQLQRPGTHARYGQLTLVDWTEFFLLHEAHHLHVIFKLAHLTRT